MIGQKTVFCGSITCLAMYEAGDCGCNLVRADEVALGLNIYLRPNVQVACCNSYIMNLYKDGWKDLRPEEKTDMQFYSLN